MISYEDLTIPTKEIVTHLMSAKDLNQKELGTILPISTQSFRNIIGADEKQNKWQLEQNQLQKIFRSCTLNH